MNVFELLGISQGEAITVNNPWSDSGFRDVIPLALSRNGISIRAIDCRYGDIRYVTGDWEIVMSDGSSLLLQDFPYIQKKINDWNYNKNLEHDAIVRSKETLKLQDIEREFATLDEVLNTLVLEHLKVAVTGTFPLPRSQVKSLLEDKGAKVMGAVSKNTAFLFMGNTGRYEVTSKMKKAYELGVKVITL